MYKTRNNYSHSSEKNNDKTNFQGQDYDMQRLYDGCKNSFACQKQ